jgi:cell division septum initiation protein DivIVA
VALHSAGFSHISFRPATQDGQGYLMDDVDEFVRVADDERRQLLNDRAALEETLRRQGRGAETPQQMMNDIAELTATLERMKASRAEAQQRLGSLRQELAQAGAAPADQEYMARVLALAQQTADRYLNDGEQRAQTLLTDARAQAEQIENAAELTAATIDGDARLRYSEAVGGLADQRAAALADIDRLTATAHDHYAVLSGALSGQLRELDGDEDAVFQGLPRQDP